MKKVILIFAVAMAFASCKGKKAETAPAVDTTVVAVDTTAVDTAAVDSAKADTTAVK